MILPGSKMRVWIDLDNSPHAHFFPALLERLKGAGSVQVVSGQSEMNALNLGSMVATEKTMVLSSRSFLFTQARCIRIRSCLDRDSRQLFVRLLPGPKPSC